MRRGGIAKTWNAVLDDVVGCAIGTFRIERPATRTPPSHEALLLRRLALNAIDMRLMTDKGPITSLACLRLLRERWKSVGSVGGRSLWSLSSCDGVGDRVDGLVHGNIGRQKLCLG